MMDDTESGTGARKESVLGETMVAPCVFVVPAEVAVVALATAPDFVAPAAVAEFAAALCLSVLLNSPEKVMIKGKGRGRIYAVEPGTMYEYVDELRDRYVYEGMLLLLLSLNRRDIRSKYKGVEKRKEVKRRVRRY